MDPRAVELSDIVKFYPTEESLKNTSVKRDDALFVSKEPFTLWQRKNDGTMEKHAPANTLTVAKTGGDFKSIEAAMDSITDASLLNPYTINWYPGLYLVDNPVTVKAFVTVRGIGQVLVAPRTPTNDVFLFETNSFMSYVAVTGATAGCAFKKLTPGNTSLENITIIDCDNGICLNNSLASLTVKDVTILTTSITASYGIQILAGQFIYDNIRIGSDAAFTVLMEFDGPDVIAGGANFRSDSPNVVNAISIKNNARSTLNHVNIIGASLGVIIASGSNVFITSGTIFNCDVGLQMDDAATRLTVRASSVEDSITLNAVLNGGILHAAGVTTNSELIFADPSVEIVSNVLDFFPGDESNDILGELHVGSPARPSEACFGEGDSYIAGMLVYTETELGVFVDETVAAKSFTGSTFTFPGIVADNAIYVGSQVSTIIDFVQHYGIKVLVETAAVNGSGEIVIEYWNGSSWIEVSGMETDADGQYFPHGNNYFQDIGGHQIRYDSQLSLSSWTKNDPPSLGTDYYWTRFRISTDITTAPIFQQFKVHSNRSEINADGWIEYFGKARPIGQLGLNFSAARPFEGNMQSQTIYVNEDVAVGFTQNKMTITNDKTGIAGFLPFDFDTSSPILLEWSGMPINSQTIEWTIRVDWVTDNGTDEYFAVEPGLSPGRKEVVISKAIVADKVSMFRALIDVKEMISRRDGAFGDEIWLSIQPTIISGTFAITSSQATYTKWCEGGHI